MKITDFMPVLTRMTIYVKINDVGILVLQNARLKKKGVGLNRTNVQFQFRDEE